MSSTLASTLSNATVIYLCVSTGQNTINIFPLQWLSPEHSYIYILSSSYMSKGGGTTRLKDFFIKKKFAHCSILEFEDTSETKTFNSQIEIGNTLWQAFQKVSRLELESVDYVIANYGGGQKFNNEIIFDLMFTIPIRRQYFSVYPEKHSNNYIIREYNKARQLQHQFQEAIHYFCDITDILALFGAEVNSSVCLHHTQDSEKIDQAKVDLYATIPNFYEDTQLHNLLLETANTSGLTVAQTKDQEGKTQHIMDIVGILESLSKNKTSQSTLKQLLSEHIIKDLNKQIENNKNQYKALQGYQLQLVNHQLKLNDIKPINPQNQTLDSHTRMNFIQIITRLRNHMLNPVFWKNIVLPHRLVPLVLRNLTIPLGTLSTALEANIKDDQYKIDSQSLKLIFSDKYGDLFGGLYSHGKYFEIIVTKHILRYLKNETNSRISAVYVNVKARRQNNYPTAHEKDYVEFDIILITKELDIYILECKTFGVSKSELTEHKAKASNLLSIFTKYLVLFPYNNFEYQEKTIKRLSSSLVTLRMHRVKTYSGLLYDTNTQRTNNQDPSMNFDHTLLPSLDKLLQKIETNAGL